MKPAVLFVDDQSSLLQSLRRSLRGFEGTWNIQYATGGSEALKAMAAGPIDVVVSDTNMPGIRGTELLTDIQTQYPKTIRMVLSGGCRNDDISLLLRTSHQFFSKPFDVSVLLKTVERVISLRDRIKDAQMQAFVSGVSKLPCAPAVHVKFHEELNNVSPDLEKLAEYIAQDIGLAAKLLQSLNSTFFGVNKAGIHPYNAVRFMGAGTIFHLFVDSVHFNTVEKTHTNYAFISDVFRRSLHMAHLMEALAEIEGIADKDKELAYTVGLLYDMGTLLLAAEKPEDFSRIKAGDSAARAAAEQKAFGAAHSDIGAYLLALWGYPAPIVDAVAYYRQPEQITIPFLDLTTLLHIAHALATGGKMNDAYLKRLGIDGNLAKWQAAHEKVKQADFWKSWKFD